MTGAVCRESGPRTVSRVALDAGCSPIQVFRFLRREREITTPVVDRLCRALGLELRPAGRSGRKTGDRWQHS